RAMAFSNADLLSCAPRCLVSAIKFKRSDTIDYILSLNFEFTHWEVDHALEAAVMENLEDVGFRILEKGKPQSVEYSVMEMAAENDCSLDFVFALCRHGSLDSRRRLMEYAVHEQMVDLAKRMAGL
ncbi:hypothetical protein HDU76_001110, partial [Blyttiomyces sp. JEL0837]